ncbi:hypothetical protein Tco_1050546, partial [Tanacetum coccineum]
RQRYNVRVTFSILVGMSGRREQTSCRRENLFGILIGTLEKSMKGIGEAIHVVSITRFPIWLLKKKSPLLGDILNTVRDQLSKTKIQCSCDIFNTGWDQWSKGTNIMSKGAFILNIDWNFRKERERLEAVVEDKEYAFW